MKNYLLSETLCMDNFASFAKNFLDYYFVLTKVLIYINLIGFLKKSSNASKTLAGELCCALLTHNMSILPNKI
jgi:hypothetical protein